MSDLWTYDDEDSALHCVGAGDAEAQLRRGWFRELDPAGDCDTQFVPCGSHDPRSVLITTWTPR